MDKSYIATAASISSVPLFLCVRNTPTFQWHNREAASVVVQLTRNRQRGVLPPTSLCLLRVTASRNAIN